MLLEPGYYTGRILNYGIKMTFKGDPAPTVKFQVKDAAGVAHGVFWQGSWQGGGMDICMEALLCMGLENPNRLAEFADGMESGVLDTERDYQLSIEISVNQNDPTKKFNKVAWINAEGGGKFKDAIDKATFAPMVEGRNLAAELARVAAAKNYTLSSSSRRVPTTDSIPF